MIETALRLRRMLKDAVLEPWPKLTGSKGLHLMSPPHRTVGHDHARAYAKHIAQPLISSAPDGYTIAAAAEKRAGRIFIEYLRNGRGTTATGCLSPRARAGFLVAAPVSWRQVENAIRLDAFAMKQPPPGDRASGSLISPWGRVRGRRSLQPHIDELRIAHVQRSDRWIQTTWTT